MDSADEAAYLPDLEAAGYQLQSREPEWYEHRFLPDFDPDVQVHVFSVGPQKRSGCCSSAMCCATTPKSVSSMSAPSVSLPPDGGRTSRTTPTPSPPSLRRSSSGLEPVEALGGVGGIVGPRPPRSQPRRRPVAIAGLALRTPCHQPGHDDQSARL